MDENLEQPSPLKWVESYTTYGTAETPLSPARCWLSAHESERLVMLIRQALNIGLGPGTAKELEQYANLIKARSAQGASENRQPTANDKLTDSRPR